MTTDTHIATAAKTLTTAAPALAPGVVTGVAKWVGLIETTLSIVMLSLSIAFLVWRWRVAYVEKRGLSHAER